MENLDISKKDFMKSFSKLIEVTNNKITQIPKNNDFSTSSVYKVFNQAFSQIDKFPELIKIGNFIPKKYNEENQDNFFVPALIPLSKVNGLCFYVNNLNKEELKNLIQVTILRLLCSLKKESIKLDTIYSDIFENDFPILKDLNMSYFDTKISSSSQEIDKFLLKITGKAIEFNELLKKEGLTNIEQYNNKFKDKKQFYRIIVISNFPSGFTEKSASLLLELIKNIENTGIHIIMSLDVGVKQPYKTEFLENLLSLMIGIYQEKRKYFKIKNLNGDESFFNEKFSLKLDLERPENLNEIINELNNKVVSPKALITESKKVTANIKERKTDKLKEFVEEKVEKIKVDISELLPNKNWIVDSIENLTIPIGKTSATEITSLLLGRDKDKDDTTSEIHHVLIAGSTGTGKKTLLHNIINITSAIYSPEELQFLLLDYKKGTEFKIYKDLPHISFFENTNERASGLNILEQLTEEIQRRDKLFSQVEKVTNFVSYRKISGKPLPRILAIVHNFEVVANVNEVFEKANALLDTILRIGDKFGINVIISTNKVSALELQNLAKVGVKIVLKMSEEDSIFTINNNLAALIETGEAIYNIKESELNTKFAFSFLNVETIKSLIMKLPIQDKAKYLPVKLEETTVIETNIEKIDTNKELIEHIKNNNFVINEEFCDLFIGSPTIKREKHIFFRLRRQIESNMIMVGKDIKSAFSILGLSLFQIIKQSTPETKFYIIDLFNVDSGFKGSFEFLKEFNNHCHIGETRNIEGFINEIIQELEHRLEEDSHKNRIILVIANLQNARKKLDQKSTSPTGRKLMKILSEGPEVGIHSFLYSETYSAFENLIDPQFINEFENKIALKGGESLNLLDDSNSLTIANNGSAILQCPYSESDKDNFKVYEFNEFLEIAKNE